MIEIKKNIENTPILGQPNYFKTQGAIDYGYFVDHNLILPYYIKKKYIFKYLIMPLNIIGEADIHRKEIFLEDVINVIKDKIKIDFIAMQHVTSLFDLVPKNSKACNFGSYIIDLTKPEDVLLSEMHSKHRNVVNKAFRCKLVVSNSINHKMECIHIIEQTMQRQNLSIPNLRSYSLLEQEKDGGVEYWTVWENDKIQGAAILLWSYSSSYYMFGGSIVNGHNGAMNLLHWEAIKKMKERGVLLYDFVGARLNPEIGSKYEGIQRFKERFGGTLKTGFLWEMPIKKFKYNLYIYVIKLMARIKNKPYVGNIIVQEINRANGKI